MTHQSGSLCSASSAGRSTGVLVGRICCVLLCLLYQKICWRGKTPSVPQSVCQAKPTVCFCLFSQTLHTLMTLSDAFPSLKKRKEECDWIELAIAAYFQMAPFNVLFSARHPQALGMDDDGVRDFRDRCTTEEKSKFFFFFLAHFLCVLCWRNGALTTSRFR